MKPFHIIGLSVLHMGCHGLSGRLCATTMVSLSQRCTRHHLTETSRACSQQYRQSTLLRASEDTKDSVYTAFTILARRERSWNRLRHLIDLATEHRHRGSVRSIVDVGTDHGLLAIGLGISGKFERVLGVDISPNALRNGGLRLQSEIENDAAKELVLSLSGTEEEPKVDQSRRLIPVDFRISDGLKQLQPGEADAVCIAGMGVNTMVHILGASSLSNSSQLDLDYLGCRQLILQPTNSKPRNLMKLYSFLQVNGWRLVDERIVYLSSRWYITACFVQTNDAAQDEASLPTSKLALLQNTSSMKGTVRQYWEHHLAWIDRDDRVSGGNLPEDDKRWRAWVLDEG